MVDKFDLLRLIYSHVIGVFHKGMILFYGLQKFPE